MRTHTVSLQQQGTGALRLRKCSLDANGNPMELHLHILQRLGHADRHSPFNLREVTREQHAALDPYRNLGD